MERAHQLLFDLGCRALFNVTMHILSNCIQVTVSTVGIALLATTVLFSDESSAASVVLRLCVVLDEYYFEL